MIHKNVIKFLVEGRDEKWGKISAPSYGGTPGSTFHGLLYHGIAECVCECVNGLFFLT